MHLFFPAYTMKLRELCGDWKYDQCFIKTYYSKLPPKSPPCVVDGCGTPYI
jgi:hypothetical protein